MTFNYSNIYLSVHKMNLHNDGSFHRAISRILLLGNIVGLPIIGILSRDASNVNFKWRSLRAIYSLCLLVMSIFFFICYIAWMIEGNNVTVQNFVSLIVFLRNIICLFLFQRLARMWNLLMRKWKSVEQYLPMQCTQSEKNITQRRIKILQIIVISISVSKLNKILKHTINNNF